MFSNSKVNENYKKTLVNISKYHYSCYNGMDAHVLSKELGLNPLYIYNYSSWYIINDKYYYYKKYNIINELFLSELAKEYNLKCVNYKLVINGNKTGIISESFRNKESKFYNYDDYFINKGIKVPRKIISLNKKIKALLNEKDYKEFINNIFKLTAFDIFSGQNDRSDGNLVIEGNEFTKIAPIFDNEGAFFDKYEYYSCFDRLYLPEYNSKELINQDNEYLFDLILNNKILYDYFIKSLDINIHDVLKRTIDKYNLYVPLKDKIELNNFFDNRKKRIENTLRLIK